MALSTKTKDYRLISSKKRKKRKGLAAGVSTMGLSEADRFYWRKKPIAF